jgi:hypothetical protein
MKTRYFGGTPDNLGVVRALPAETFTDLVSTHLRQPVSLGVTKAQLLAMPPAEATKAKATDYLVPATFKSDTSQRRTELAVVANLIFIDIDDAIDARRLLATGFGSLLGRLDSVVYHTARSTPAAPRLRVVVSAEEVPIARYAEAVRLIAALLGMEDVSRESLVPVQPMFLPTSFADDTTDPVVHCSTKGEAFVLPLASTLSELPAGEADAGDVSPLENLRPRMEGVNPEDIRPALQVIDPDCAMKRWVEIGMALKHQFGDEGYALWDDWSARGKAKYPGSDATRRRWDSFSGQTSNRVPVTLRTVLRIAEESGWDNKLAGENVYSRTVDWITSSTRSTEELLDHAAGRISAISPLIGPLKQAALVGTLARTLKNRGIQGVTATSLTQVVKDNISESTKPTQPPTWASGVVFVTASNLFYRYVDNRKLKPEVVDLIYRSPDPEKRPREWLIHDANIKVVENLRYDPETKARVVMYDGVPFCNTYRPTYPAPDYGQLQEVLDFFGAHADHVFTSQWSRTMFDFGAYLVQHPGKKIRWAPLVQSGVGAGKGLWAGLLTRALGFSNVQRLSAEHVLEATYNSWASGYQLTVMDEVYNVGANSHRTMSKLKPSISDDFVSVRSLYEPVQTVPNIMNFLMFTNYHNSLAVHDSDRRYFVIKSPLQTKDDILALGGPAYFEHAYKLLSSHAAGIRALFESWPISKDFPADGRAPITPFLHELAAATASPLAAAVQDALDDRPHALLQPDLLSLPVLRAHLPAERLSHFTDQGLASVLREKGFVSAGRHSFDGVRHALWVRGFKGDPVAEANARREVL